MKYYLGKFLTGMVILLWIISLFAQSPDTLKTKTSYWTKTYGGKFSDVGYSVQQTSDNGYVIAGVSNSFGPGLCDVYIIKTDREGDTIWTKTYGGKKSDFAFSVQQTSDGGYVVAGFTWSFAEGFRDVYIIKIDSSGRIIWTKTYGGKFSDVGYSIQQTFDGGYIVVGSTFSFGKGDYDLYLIKTNEKGDTLWTKTYGGTGDDFGRSIQQTFDSGYIVTGYTNSFGEGDQDVYLIKADVDGDTVWTKTYGGAKTDESFSVQQTLAGGYIIAGWTASFGEGDFDTYIIETDANGDVLWTRVLGGQDQERATSVQLTVDRGYIITGYTKSFGRGIADVYLIKIKP
ncbi:MAG: hypothetical protein E3J87_07785 [Candidatus Cloacimonadota bacterium]|nr:MAG: hypothetical protein E3J87_07785 [Candidatus Cloacimonadota bacterium]